jgi:hypothetical protein
MSVHHSAEYTSIHRSVVMGFLLGRLMVVRSRPVGSGRIAFVKFTLDGEPSTPARCSGSEPPSSSARGTRDRGNTGAPKLRNSCAFEASPSALVSADFR